MLPESLVLRIAAGEVIERPASVLKELVENSIDAGARRIEVEIEGGGKERIEVKDDGMGILPDDIPSLFLRHATSKINSEEDLQRILSYGFRGEALASIGGVARVKLVSRAEGYDTGYSIEIHGGELKKKEEVAVQRGTRVLVWDLFYNVTVRKKFLKSIETEKALVSAVFERFAIVHRDKYMKLTMDSRTIFDLQPVMDLEERLKIIFGEETASKLLPFTYRYNDITVDGFASPPEVTDIRGSYIYVNRRFVRDRLIQKAIQRGYTAGKERMEPYFVILFLTLPPEMVDVNVHPQKYEVRFRDSGKVFSAVSNAITVCFRKVISGTGRREGKEQNTEDIGQKTEDREEDIEKIVSTARYERVKESLESYLIKEGFLKYSEGPQKSEIQYSPDIEILLRDVIPVGQLFRRYIICEAMEGILLIDQHAAHEILTFYKLKQAYEEKMKESQYLLHPEVIELPQSKIRIIHDNRDLLSAIGFDIESFGENSVVIRSVPEILSNENIKSIVTGLVEALCDFDTIDDSALNKILSTIACHTSVRSGEKLSYNEMISLINDLRKALVSPYCPHGRPVLKFFSLKEIETWFRRR